MRTVRLFAHPIMLGLWAVAIWLFGVDHTTTAVTVALLLSASVGAVVSERERIRRRRGFRRG